jgi:hypothetical protein
VKEEEKKLAFLNNLVGVNEYEVEQQSGNYVHKLWEWKEEEQK